MYIYNMYVYIYITYYMATSVHLLFSSPRLLCHLLAFRVAMRRAAAAKAAPGGKNGSLGGEPLELEKLPPQERCEKFDAVVSFL